MAKVSFMRKEEPKFNVPSLAAVSPVYAALVMKRDKLAAQLGKLQNEQSALMEEIARTTIPLARRERDARVAELLGDESAAAISRPHVRLSKIGQEIADVKAAIGLLTDQISQARHKASEKILEDVRRVYAERIAACCEALLALRETSAAYAELTDELTAKDIAWIPLNPMPIGFCGDPSDRYSKYGQYLREAAKSGYFPYDRIPTELR